MSYTICISPLCAICQEIMLKLKDMKIDIEVKNLDISDDCKVSIIPALFHEKRLIAYGKDIIRYFRLKNLRKEPFIYY